MPERRSAPTRSFPVLALCTVLAVSAWSAGGDAPAQDAEPSSDPAGRRASDSGRPDGPVVAADTRSRGCTAEVRVTGAVEASWEGKATVRRPLSQGAAVTAVYDTSAEEGSLNAVSGAGGNPDVAVVTVDRRNFSTVGQEGTLEVSASKVLPPRSIQWPSTRRVSRSAWRRRSPVGDPRPFLT